MRNLILYDLMQFIATQIAAEKKVLLIQVVESIGSSPGRAGFRMAIAFDEKLENGNRTSFCFERRRPHSCSKISSDVSRN